MNKSYKKKRAEKKASLHQDPNRSLDEAIDSVRPEYKHETSYNTQSYRLPIITDIGAYLRTLRVNAGISAAEVGKKLNLTARTIYNIEYGQTYPPDPERIRDWLIVLGEIDRFAEALALYRQYRTHRTIYFRTRDEANEHIDRIIDAYQRYGLTDTDIALLRMIAPNEYQTHRRFKVRKKTKRATPSPSPEVESYRGKKKYFTRRLAPEVSKPKH